MRRLYQLFQNLTKTERRVFWGALAVFATSSLFWAGSYFYKNTVETPIASSRYTEGIIGQPIFLNPAISGANDADRDLSEIIFSGLLDLSDRYAASDDKKTWRISLKPNLVWDDGKPLNSDDVIFTLETIQNPETRSPLFPAWQGVVAERVSELEVEFILRTPYAFFPDNLKSLKIIPAHIFGATPSANIRLSSYNLEPVGSGPYKFVSYQKRKNGFISEYNFEINEKYFSKKPFIKNLTVKFFPGAEEIINAFNSRKIDGFGDLDPKDISRLKLSRQIIEVGIPRYYAVFFNPNSREVLKDLSVRTALNLAVDREKIITRVFQGKALAVSQPLPLIAPDLAPQNLSGFNLEKAAQTLDKNGWLKNADGIREKKSGKKSDKLEFDLIVPQISFLQETVDIIKEDWQTLGIKLNPIILNPSDVANEVIKTRNYQMLVFGNILKLNPDVFSFWHSSERFYPGLNLALYENKKADSLLEAIRKNFDEISRAGELKQLQTLIANDQPAIFLFSPAYLYAAPRSLGGFEEKILATPSDRFKNISQWHLKTARVFK